MRGGAEIEAGKSVCGLARLPVFTAPVQTGAALILNHSMNKILFDSAPADGGNSAPQTAEQNNLPQTGAVTIPHTAAIVLSGERSEREVNLQAEIDRLTAQVGGSAETIKQRETRINQLEDENRALKLARETPQPGTIQQTKRGQWKKGWKGYALADETDSDDETED